MSVKDLRLGFVLGYGKWPRDMEGIFWILYFETMGAILWLRALINHPK